MSASADFYLPCLMTRLTDEHPEQARDAAAPLLSLAQLKQEIVQNIALILNSRSHLRAGELKDPALRYSVLDFGISDFCGCQHSQQQLNKIKYEIQQALQHFEPRVNPATILVEAEDGAAENGQGSVYKLKIVCEINVEPLEGEILLVSYLDLEAGSAEVKLQE